jgi:hypothetical protein
MNSISCTIKLPECCAGRGCQKKGNVRLRVQILDKVGYFCDSCAKEILHLGLAVNEKRERPLKSDSRVARSNHSIADATIKVIRDS